MQLRGLFFMSSLLCAAASYGQGCSDAGFCTAGTMQGGKAVADSSNRPGSIGLSVTAGAGENGTMIWVPQLEGSIGIGRRGVLEGKLPYSVASGNLGRHAGPGDPIITYSHILAAHPGKLVWTATVGLRIGINNANATDGGRALPMPYQSGLGTTDVIVGLGAKYRHWLSGAIGYQQPVWQYNDNGYLPAILYPTNAADTLYFASRRLRRKGDLLARVEVGGHWHRWAASAGPLLICHLGTDNITLADGSSTALQGSAGATLNLSGTLAYTTGRMKITLIGGSPFIVRTYRPDGLTRSWVITLRYSYNLR